MPYSSENGKAAIKRIMRRIAPKTGLDIGAGSGTYAKLFPDTRWIGVEIYEPYIEKFGLRDLYDRVTTSDIREWTLENTDQRWDVAIAGDVLEHIAVEEAQAVLGTLRKLAKHVIVSIPIGYYPQDEYDGNPYEAHVKDDWTDEEVRSVFGEPTFSQIEGEIGVYLYGGEAEIIPNIVHFIWFTGPKSRDFNYINYLAIRAAHDVQKPYEIFMWCNEDIQGNPHWDAIRPYVTLKLIEPPSHIGGHSLEYPQYQADVVRLQKLFEYGGIYLDTDMFLLKSLTPFMDNQCVMSAEGYDKSGRIKSLNAGLIMAEPGSPFIQTWLNRLPQAIRSDTWANQAVVLPLDIFIESPGLLHLEPAQSFIPFNFHDEWIYGGIENATKLDNSYSVHMYDTYWENVASHEIRKINDRYMLTVDNLFTHLFRKYALGKPLKICVYAISKNEEKFVDRFCVAAKDADLIVIADTGSTDETVKLARQHGAKVHDICVSPWRFDTARNAALTLIPKDIDICISLDLDEELQPGWREEIERVWFDGATRLRYKFDWGCGIVFFYEKIHARHGYRWHHPCHEYPVPDRIEERWAHTDMLLAVHKPDPSKSRGQYLDLLRVSIEEDPQDPRNAFYYCRELSFHSQWVDSIIQGHRYLNLPKATWPNERCYAMRTMGRCYNELGQTNNAREWFNKAAAEAPDTREPWCELAMLEYRQGNWRASYDAAMRALQVNNRELVYTVDPAVWGSQPHDLASIAAWNLGLKGIALEQAKLAVKKDPEDERLRANLILFNASNDISPQLEILKEL